MSQSRVLTTFADSGTDPGHGAQRPVAHVTLENTQKLNCLDSAQVTNLIEAIEALAKRNDLAAVVVTGAGSKSFIGGADLRELGGLDADGVRLYITRLHQACQAIRDCPVPVIARINGFCLGAGLEVAASCDMRVASSDAVFGMPEVHMGLPSVVEAALLPGLIGWGKTREILITGDTFDAAEALAMRFVERVVAPDELDAAVSKWTDAIARAAPRAVRAQKKLIARWERVSVDEAVYAGIDAISDAYKTGEPTERIAAFFAERARIKAAKTEQD